MSLAILANRAKSFGAPLDRPKLAAFELYRDELLLWNQRVNLTSITDPAGVELRLFVDSLSCLAALADLLEETPNASLIDVGAGAGFPGLPLKIAQPAIRLTLLDSVRKKTAFLDHLVTRLGLGAVTVLTARAEDLARSASHRECYDVVVSRALGPVPLLLELCLPFLRVGGRFVAPRRGDLLAQQHEAKAIALELGGSFQPPLGVDLGAHLRDYGLVIVDKTHPTPDRYPRRAGVPAKRPLQ